MLSIDTVSTVDEYTHYGTRVNGDMCRSKHVVSTPSKTFISKTEELWSISVWLSRGCKENTG